MLMFFKFRKTQVEDDFDDLDNFDDWDDFGLDDAGFEDATPKSKPREAVTAIKGGFFSGLKDAIFSPNNHKKILQAALPEGYVAHYDDAREALKQTKGLYDTVKKEGEKTHDAFRNEVAPHLLKYNEKKQTKLSRKLAKYAEKARREVPSNTISEEEMAYTSAANEIFGTALAKQQNEMLGSMAVQSDESARVSQALQQQANELMLHTSNSLQKQNAFNDQVAMKWQRKMLELKYKHYFTARKQLEIATQQSEYLQATLPNIVKNTGLPDAVKITLSEQGMQMFKERAIGSLQNVTRETAMSIFGGVIGKTKDKVTEQLRQLTDTISGGALSSGLNMFNGDDEFSMSPTQFMGNLAGGFLSDTLVNKLIKSSEENIRGVADRSTINFEEINEKLNMLREVVPGMFKRGMEQGFGDDKVDGFLNWIGADDIVKNRNKKIQSSLVSELDQQALFDLETKKSITSVIPSLLSEIHGEIYAVRNGMGFDAMDKDNRLRIDWETGTLNTHGNLRTKLVNRLTDPSRKSTNNDITYDMFEKMGFDKTSLIETGELKDEQGNTLLDKEAVTELAKAMKAKSFDPNEVFDIVEFARGSKDIKNKKANEAIQKFFRDKLGVNENQMLLTEGNSVIEALKDRALNSTTEQNKYHAIMAKALGQYNQAGISEGVYTTAAKMGQTDLLLEAGAAGLETDGSVNYNPNADAEMMYSGDYKMTDGRNLYRGKINNKYGAQDHADNAFRQKLMDKARKKRDKKIQAKENKAWNDYLKTLSYADKVKAGLARQSNSDDYKQWRFDNGFAVSLEDQSSPLVNQREYRVAPILSQVDSRNFNDSSPISPNWRPTTVRSEPPTPPVPPVPEPPVDDGSAILSTFISEKVKGFLDNVLSKFSTQDFINMADGVKKGLQNFLTALADKGIPLTPQEDAARSTQILDGNNLTEENIKTLTDNFATATGYAMANLLRALREPGTNQNGSGNFFFGGTVPHFRKGGKVRAKGKNKSYIREIKKAVDDAMGNTAAKQIFTPAPQTNLLSPIQKAIEKEKALGGDPQVVVASAGEEILSTQNGDAQFFRKLKQNGLWNTLKSTKDDVLAERENDGEWKGLFRELGRETEKSATKYGNKAKTAATQALDGKGHSLALMLHDIRNDTGKELVGPQMPFMGPQTPAINRDDINLPDEVKAVGRAVYNKLMTVTDGKKELVEKYWNDISAKLPEGAKPELIKKRLEERLKNLNEGKFGVISKQVSKLKGALNIEGLAKDQDGNRDVKGWAKGRATSAKDKVKNAYNEFDKEGFKQGVKDKFSKAKDFTKSKFDSTKGVFFDEEGNPIFTLPSSFSLLGSNSNQLDAIATITRQMAELIRTNAFIAVNTGTPQSDASPIDVEAVKPYDVPGKKSTTATKGKLSKLFGNIKAKFNKEPQLDENGNPVENPGRLNRFKAWVKGKTGSNKDFIGPQQPKFSRIVGGKLKFFTDKGRGFIQRNKDKEKNVGKYFDVFIKGQKKPVISAMSFQLGNYIDLTTGNILKTPEDITGPVASLSGKVVITQEDFDNGIVVKKATNLGVLKDMWNRKRSLSKAGKNTDVKPNVLARVLKGADGTDGILGKWKNRKKTISDVYIKGETTPVMKARDIEKGLYFDVASGRPLESAKDIKGAVKDKNGNIVITDEQVANNELVFTDGTGMKKGIIRRLLGFSFRTSGKMALGSTKAGWWMGGKFVRGIGWTAGKTGKGVMWGGKKLFGYNMAEDIYVLGEKEPRLLAKEMKAGNYYCKDKKDKKIIIKSFDDINGAVYDKDDNIVVTEQEVKDKLLMTKSGKKKKSIVGMLASGIGTMMGKSAGLGIGIVTAPFKWLFGHRSKGVGDKSGFITYDIYVNDPDDRKVRILSKKVPDNFYLTKDKQPVLKYDQLDKPVYDKDGNLVITEEDIKKGLVTPNGTPIGKLAGGLFKTVKFGFGVGFGLAKGILNVGKAVRSVVMAPFKLVGGLWKGLKGFGGLMSDAVTKMLGMRGFDVDGRNKDALMIQAQAMAVDKLEMIRLLLDQRLIKPKKAQSNDKDGDGVRDGSYLDQLRRKARGEDKKKEREKKQEEKDKKKGEKDKDEKSSLFSSLILKALIGGAIGGLIGPKIISGITMSIRNILPSWLGGYSDEQKANIEKNGGIFSSVMKDIDPNTGESKSKGKADPNDPNAKASEEGGFSWKGAALGAGALMFPRLAMKTIGLPFTALRMGSNAVGLTSKLGIEGLGKRAAVSALAQGAGRFLLGSGATTAATAALGTQAATAGTAAAAGGVAAAQVGAAGAATAATGAAASGGLLATLASNPVGWTIAAVVGAGLLAYGGYKTYKWLTKKDENQLARWRMAQYGYKLSDENHAVKVLDLEDYLSKYTTRSSKTSPARITEQANIEDALKIFGINPSSQRDIESFKTWFFYRFKPVYISWKTAAQNVTGNDDISKLDDILLKADKIRMVTDTNFSSEDRNPYNYIQSPFAGESSVKLEKDEVLEVHRNVISSLEDIDEEEHDARIVRNGGGKNKTKSDNEQSESYKAITAASATAKANSRFNSGGITAGNTNQDSKNTAEAKSGQSWWNKLINGDNATDEGRGMSLGDKVSNALGDLFFGSGTVASGTVDFAKSFTKGLRVGNLTEAQTAAMAADTANTESKFRLGVINKYGYAGLYQFGGQALADIGFMKKVGGGWREQNAAMKNPSNWNNGLSLEKFLSSRALQDQAWVALANKNIQYGQAAARDNAGKFQGMVQDYRLMAKYIKMAHLKGPGNAVKGLLYGQDARDGNNTSMISYGNGAAANVEAILKQMGGATPTGNPDINVKTQTKTGNPAYDLGAKAGAAVRGKVQQWMGTDKPLPTPKPASKPSPVTTGYDSRSTGIMGGLTAKQMANKPSSAPAAIAKPNTTGKPAGSTSGFNALSTGIMGGLTSKQMIGKDKPVAPPKPTKNAPSYTTADGKFSMVSAKGAIKNTAPTKTPTLVEKAFKGTGITPVDNNFSVAAGSGNTIGARIAWAAQTLLGNTMDNYTKWCGRGTITILRKAQVPGLTPYTGNASSARYWPSAGADAKNLGPIIESLGWVQVPSNENPVNGDIDILGPDKRKGDGHPGHIQVFGNGYWWSDTKQSKRLRDQYKWVKFYRHKDAGPADAVGSTLNANGLDGAVSNGPKVTTPKMIQALQRTASKAGNTWKAKEYYLGDTSKSTGTGKKQLSDKPNIAVKPVKKMTLSESMGIKVKPTAISPVDMTPSGYKDKVLPEKNEIPDKPNAGNSVLPPTPKSETNTKKDDLEDNGVGNSVIPNAAESSKEINKAVEKDKQIAKVTQKTIKSLEAQKQNNINDVKAQKLQLEKKQQLEQTNHGVLKEQLRLQTLMQADISSMNKILKDIRDLAAANSKGSSVGVVNNNQKPDVHQRMKIKDTPEPISMKVN